MLKKRLNILFILLLIISSIFLVGIYLIDNILPGSITGNLVFNNVVAIKNIGEICSRDAECGSNVCSVGDGNIKLCLVSNLPPNQRCRSSKQCSSHLCINSQGIIDGANGVCLINNQAACTQDSECVSNNCYLGECQARLATLGSYCPSNSNCYSNNCRTHLCAQGTNNGNPCLYLGRTDECTSGKSCIRSTYFSAGRIVTEKKCSQKLAYNIACRSGDDCVSGRCYLDKCELGTKYISTACSNNNECRSLVCQNSRCIKGNVPLGTSCTADEQCIRGSCENNVCSINPNARFCSVDSECASSFCASGICRKRVGQSCNAQDTCDLGSRCILGMCKIPFSFRSIIFNHHDIGIVLNNPQAGNGVRNCDFYLYNSLARQLNSFDSISGEMRSGSVDGGSAPPSFTHSFIFNVRRENTINGYVANSQEGQNIEDEDCNTVLDNRLLLKVFKSNGYRSGYWSSSFLFKVLITVRCESIDNQIYYSDLLVNCNSQHATLYSPATLRANGINIAS